MGWRCVGRRKLAGWRKGGEGGQSVVEHVLCEMWLCLAKRMVAPQHQWLPVTTICDSGAVFLCPVCNLSLLGTVQAAESLP